SKKGMKISRYCLSGFSVSEKILEDLKLNLEDLETQEFRELQNY
ncbi:6536_t:CDS:1, partial [Dentiscutata erythropus]